MEAKKTPAGKDTTKTVKNRSLIKAKEKARDPLSVFTVTEAAAICDFVAFKTITKWAEQGKLKAYRMPTDRKDYRIYRDDLLAFLLEHGMGRNFLPYFSGACVAAGVGVAPPLEQVPAGWTSLGRLTPFEAVTAAGRGDVQSFLICSSLGPEVVVDLGKALATAFPERKPRLTYLAGPDKIVNKPPAGYDGVVNADRPFQETWTAIVG